MKFRFAAALLLCMLLGASVADALPAALESRRALMAQRKPQEKLQIETLRFVNKCKAGGVDMRLHFLFDGAYDWFGERTTSQIPGIFVDYFCDNIGQVNYQYAPPDNHLNDPKIQRKIREGVCLNEHVYLRTPGWQGRGPQDILELEVPRSTVHDMWVALNPEQSTPLAIKKVIKSAWRTADFSKRCRRGSKGCLKWFKVKATRPVEFVCASKHH